MTNDDFEAKLEYLRNKIAYYEAPNPFRAGQCAHKFTDEGICIRCGEDAEEWDAGCVEEIVAEALEWRSELEQLKAREDGFAVFDRAVGQELEFLLDHIIDTCAPEDDNWSSAIAVREFFNEARRRIHTQQPKEGGENDWQVGEVTL